MDLKTICKKRGIRSKELSAACGIPYSTVNDLLNQKTELARVSFGAICRIADYLNLSLEEMREGLDSTAIHTPQYDVVVRNKRYYLCLAPRESAKTELESPSESANPKRKSTKPANESANPERISLCRSDQKSKQFLADIAEMTFRELCMKKEMEEAERHAVLPDASK